MLKKLFSPRYLVVTNTGLGVTFLALGDCTQQHLRRLYLKHQDKQEDLKKWKFDSFQVGCMAKTGFIFGAAGHYWYKFLDFKFPGVARQNLIRKLFVEMLAGPPFAFLTFFSVGFFENKPLKTSWNNYWDNFFILCLADCGFYVPLQFFNFKFVPTKYRFLYVACITIVYDTFLSFILHKNDHAKKQ